MTTTSSGYASATLSAEKESVPTSTSWPASRRARSRAGWVPASSTRRDFDLAMSKPFPSAKCRGSRTAEDGGDGGVAYDGTNPHQVSHRGDDKSRGSPPGAYAPGYSRRPLRGEDRKMPTCFRPEGAGVN